MKNCQNLMVWFGWGCFGLFLLISQPGYNFEGCSFCLFSPCVLCGHFEYNKPIFYEKNFWVHPWDFGFLIPNPVSKMVEIEKTIAAFDSSHNFPYKSDPDSFVPFLFDSIVQPTLVSSLIMIVRMAVTSHSQDGSFQSFLIV